MKNLLTIFLAGCIVLGPGIIPVLAQTGGQPGEFSRMGFSPRGMAMGNAMTAVDQEGSYGYYNPAMAAIPGETIQVDISTAALKFDRQLHMVTGHFQLPPMAGLSISIINARVGNIDGRTQSGYHTDFLSTAEYQMFGNFALRFSESIWAGIGIKYNLANYHTDVPSSSGVGIDFGVRAEIASGLVAGIAIKDLLSKNDIDTAELYSTDTAVDSGQPFPTRLLLGVSYEFTDKWLMSLDFEQRLHQAKQVRTVTEQNNGFDQTRIIRDDVNYSTQFIRAGSRYHLHERVTFRAGVQFNDMNEESSVLPSGGFSLHLPFDRFSPSIDYAFTREPNSISNMHVFSLRLNI